jgi:hypothetical protein
MRRIRVFREKWFFARSAAKLDRMNPLSVSTRNERSPGLRGHDPMYGIRKFAIAVAAVFCLPCAALSPLTPRFTNSTRLEMESRLAAVGLPEVAHSSVWIAIMSALGFQPDDQTFHYREPYPQLPEVDVTATAVSRECSEVVADIRMARANVQARLRGRYCLVGPAEWEARSQSVQPFP